MTTRKLCGFIGVLASLAIAAPSAAMELCFEQAPATAVAHNNAGCATAGGKIYVWSGYTSTGGRTTVGEVYDPAVGVWGGIADVPSARNGAGDFALADQLYFVGGEGPSSGLFTKTVFRYDPALNTWSTLNEFPVDIWDPVHVVCEGRAFLIGGRHGYGQTYDHVYEYIPGSDTWEPRAPMPYSVMQAGRACHEGKVYVFGGVHKPNEPTNEFVRHMQIYDPAANSWQFLPDAMPRLFTSAVATSYGGKIFVFACRVYDSGSGTFVDNTEVDVYDPATGSWSLRPLTWPLYNGLWGGYIARLGSFAYFVDWIDGGVNSNVVQSIYLAAGMSADCDGNGVPDECELDTDGDGVIDACDGCPEDPLKTAPGICGCGVPDIDSDGDGVADCIDNCPAVYNPDQADCDGDGIGDLCDDDRDGDGVLNAADACPDTPGCSVMPDGRPRLDMNNDCNVDGLDMQVIVQELLAGCSTCN